MNEAKPEAAPAALTAAQTRLQERIAKFSLKASNPKKQTEAWGLWGELRDVVPESLRKPLQSVWDLVKKGAPAVQLELFLNEVRKVHGIPEVPTA